MDGEREECGPRCLEFDNRRAGDPIVRHYVGDFFPKNAVGFRVRSSDNLKFIAHVIGQGPSHSVPPMFSRRMAGFVAGLTLMATFSSVALAEAPLAVLIVAPTGGLGRTLVKEALARGHAVSVLTRSPAQLSAALGEATVAQLAHVHHGAGEDAATVAAAAKSADVIVSAAPPVVGVAATLSAACRQSAACRKLVWVAGSSNMKEADGSYHYHSFAGGEGYFKAHAPVIAAIQASGVNHVVFCPGVMKAGTRNPNPPILRTASKDTVAAWDYCSYEDAAQTMLTVAAVGDYDGSLVQTVSPAEKPQGKKGDL